MDNLNTDIHKYCMQIDKNKKDLILYFNRGKLYQNSKNYELALFDYNAAIN